MLVTEKTIVSLRKEEGDARETRNYCEAVADLVGLNLISPEDAWRNRSRIFVANIRFVSEITSDATIRGDSEVDSDRNNCDMPIGEFVRCRTDIRGRNPNLFSSPTGVLPPSKNDFRIVTDPLTKAAYRQPYHQLYAEREEFAIQICQLIANGWVSESNSRFAAPIIFVKKADGKLRMYCDYRGLNLITLKDRYPMPYIDDLFDRLHGSQNLTKLERSGHFHADHE